MWKTEGQANQYRRQDQSVCVDAAHEIHDFWCSKGTFPLLWSHIDFDREKVVSIFSFFCGMEMLLGTTEAKSVLDHLLNRLFARWPSDVDPSDLECEAESLKDKIKLLSKEQIAAFRELEKKELIFPAFELFVSGTLTYSRKQFMTKEIPAPDNCTNNIFELKRDSLPNFEPDGPAFFRWAEFALLAADFGIDKDSWIQILPVLLRSEKIFALCYGEPEKGTIPPERIFADYGLLNFTPLHPLHAQAILQTSSTTLVELEAEATECARFAFPREFD